LKDKSGNNQANEALDEYLELLLSSDEEMACEQQSEKSVPLSGSKLYHLDSHPSRKHRQQEERLNSRHNIERVERLLDDFNRRQIVEESIEEQQVTTSIANENNILLQPSVLQPEIIEPPVTEVVEPEAETVILVEPAPSVIIPESREFIREEWSEDSFQTLLFDVAGLTLALPLVKLGGIHRIEDDITPLFGKPDWFMGLTPGINGNISVVDTTRWVMPEKYHQAEQAGLDYKFIILLGDSNWGLACSEVQNAIALTPENVRWRATAGKRPWLAGMLIDEMCALLDVDTLIYLLDENFPR